jgi:hypothetical protein
MVLHLFGGLEMKKKPINSSSFYELLAPPAVAKETTFKVTTRCENCGADFKAHQSELFCSYICAKYREGGK